MSFTLWSRKQGGEPVFHGTFEDIFKVKKESKKLHNTLRDCIIWIDSKTESRIVMESKVTEK